VVVGRSEDGPVAGVLDEAKQRILFFWNQVLREYPLPVLQPLTRRILSGSRAIRALFPSVFDRVLLRPYGVMCGWQMLSFPGTVEAS